VEIDLSNMPISAKKEGYDLGKFQMSMIRYTEGMDIENYKVPVARYYYDEVNELIQLDKAFFKQRKKQVELVAQANQNVVEENQAELDAVQEDYNVLIRDADIEFEAQDYKLAKEYYQEALKLKPLAEYPRKQIKIINGYLAQNLGEEEKYKTLIEQGDEAFETKDFESALLAYKSAIKIKTTENYPREQIKKAEAILAEQAAKKEQAEDKVYSLKNVQISAETKGLSNELAKKYPQGLTIEKFMEGSKSVERRIIVDGDIGVEYKKITHNWGGVYYFKNGKPANHFIWQKEAIQ
jgi:tetratricopeptide (TPR) repeat protein